MRHMRNVSRALTLALLSASAGCGDVLPDLSDLVDAAVADESDASETPVAADEMPVSIQKPADGVRMASKKIESSGEVVTRSGGLSVPEGALREAAEITIAEVAADDIRASAPRVLEPVAPATAFTPHGMTFKEDVTLTLFYEAPAHAKLVALRLDDESDTSWEVVPAEFHDNVALVKSKHFSIYTVMGCDPNDDPEGYCTDLADGHTAIADLPTDTFVAFQPPANFGDGTPEPVGPGSSSEKHDAGIPEARDAAVADDASMAMDGGVGQGEDASAAGRSDAGVAGHADAGMARDAGDDAGSEQACSWVEVCNATLTCAPVDAVDGGTDAGTVPPLKDGNCPSGYTPVRQQDCHLEPHCTQAWCEAHPADCKEPAPTADAGSSTGDAGVGVAYDGGRPVEDGGKPVEDGGYASADGGAAASDGGTSTSFPPGCYPAKHCETAYECRPDSGVASDAGAACSEQQVCHEQACDLPPDCHQECREVKACSPSGVCDSKQDCQQICAPSKECPAPVCQSEMVCRPIAQCSDKDIIPVQHCYETMQCDADAGSAATTR